MAEIRITSKRVLASEAADVVPFRFLNRQATREDVYRQIRRDKAEDRLGGFAMTVEHGGLMVHTKESTNHGGQVSVTWLCVINTFCVKSASFV